MVHANRNLETIIRDSDRLGDRSGFVCLDRNERIGTFPDGAFAEMVAEIKPEHFMIYPDLGPLYDRLQAYTGLNADQLCVGAGSDGIIRRTFQAFLQPGDRFISPSPSYAMYGVYAPMFGAEHITVAYREDLSLDVDLLCARIGEGCRMVAVANPDQPIGGVLAMADIKRIISAARDADALCLIDEAYFPFHDESAISLIADFDNLLVTRTFSKVGGLAGLRVGYGAAAPNIIQALHKVRGSGEVNAVGVLAACYLLDHPGVMEQNVKDVAQGRALLLEMAQRLGLQAPDCRANFQMLLLPDGISSKELVEGVKRRGYLIKGAYPHPGLENSIRVTLAAKEIIDPFCKVLEEVVKEIG